MSSPTNSHNDYYGLFKFHLLVDVLALPEDSPPMRALLEGAGINLLTNFLLQPPSYYEAKLTYDEVREDGSVTLMAIHPTYVALLMALYLWCHEIIGGNCIPPHSDWLRMSRVEFFHFLENVLWETGEVPRFTFPIIRVLPGTLLKVLKTMLVPVQPPPVLIEEIAPNYKEQVLSSKESSPEVAPVLLASLDVQTSLVFNWVSHSWAPPVPTIWPPMEYEELGSYDEGPSPSSHGTFPDYLLVLQEVPVCSPLTPVGSPDKGDRSIPRPRCSPDTFLSLVFDKEPSTPSPTCSPNVFFGIGFSPTCSPDIFLVPKNDSYCLAEKQGFDCQKRLRGPK